MAKIVDDAQIDLNSPVYLIILNNQEGEHGGEHCLRLIQTGVKCNGEMTDESAKFRVYHGRYKDENVCVLQCASGPEKDKVICIRDNKVYHRKPEFDYTNPSTTINISRIDDDVLFNYVFSGEDPTLRSFRLLSNTNMVLGFDTNGTALPPGEVKIDTEQSLFFVYNDS